MWKLSVGAAIVAGAMTATAAAQPPLSVSGFRSFSVFGAQYTQAYGINNQGVIVGAYGRGNPPVFRGFIKNGPAVTRVDYPGSQQTFLRAINLNGRAVGSYIDATGAHPFLYDPAIAPFYFRLEDQPYSVPQCGGYAAGVAPLCATGINDGGQMVGSYTDETTGMQHGWLFDGAIVHTRDVYSGQYKCNNQPCPTYLTGINSMTGSAYTASIVDVVQLHEAFLFDGKWKKIYVPGASEDEATSLNDKGFVTMEAYSAGFPYPQGEGALFRAGNYVTFNPPGALYSYALGINDSNVIVGWYEAVGRRSCLVGPSPRPCFQFAYTAKAKQ